MAANESGGNGMWTSNSSECRIRGHRLAAILRRACAGLMLLSLATVSPAWAAIPGEELPQELAGLDVVEHLDQSLPLTTEFRDSREQVVRLEQVFDGQRPVIVSLNYADCPMLCNLQLNGMIDGLKQVKLSVGQDYQVVSISLDPNETAERAESIRERLVELYGRDGAAAGWHFLRGDRKSIDAVAEALGIGYRYLPAKREYSHPAVFVVCSPAGRISRYVYGVAFQPRDLQLSLVDASEGRSGTAFERFLLFCFHYDRVTGRYTPHVKRLLQLAAVATVITLAAAVWWMKSRERTTRLQPRGVLAVQPAPSLPV